MKFKLLGREISIRRTGDKIAEMKKRDRSIKAAYTRGQSIPELAVRFSLTENRISQIITDGETRKAKWRKMSPATRKRIFALAETGISKAEIGRRVGCSRERVRQILLEFDELKNRGGGMPRKTDKPFNEINTLLSAYVPIEMKEELEAFAKRSDKSVSECLREAVEIYLATAGDVGRPIARRGSRRPPYPKCEKCERKDRKIAHLKKQLTGTQRATVPAKEEKAPELKRGRKPKILGSNDDPTGLRMIGTARSKISGLDNRLKEGGDPVTSAELYGIFNLLFDGDVSIRRLLNNRGKK